MKKLGLKEVNSVVAYIGGEGGYLRGFTYRTHADFYPEHCGLDINPEEYGPTTRKRFIKILVDSDSLNQNKILSGVLSKCPLTEFEDLLNDGIISNSEYGTKARLHEKILKWIDELKGLDLIELDESIYDFEFVKEVLDQADTLISNHSYSSAIDRTHTALHSYLKQICNNAGLKFEDSLVDMQAMWSKIRNEHPNFLIDSDEHYKPINQIVNAIMKLLKNINDIRNSQSFSHPNEEIIEEKEAKLVINLTRVVLQYIDSKISNNL
ncbi:hypothetical protein BHL37_00700 [Bacillus cereus]|nr:hypothetical protein BHL37_00700 [Bacillus cereus]